MSYFEVGKLGRAFGLRGEIRLFPNTDFPERFQAGARFRAVRSDQTEAMVELDSVRMHQGNYLVRIKGVETPEAAAVWVNATLYVPEEALYPLQEGRYYIYQILGSRVESTEGEPLGQVVDVRTDGAQDLWTVRDAQGRDHLVPVVDAFIRNVDLSQHRIVVSPIAGLFDSD
ncbi:MAG: 16S rRNA processing protein RimM [Firmicutes bacterium]|nr:16S rRNA processing protein RimM [Bacillota bacterium]